MAKHLSFKSLYVFLLLFGAYLFVFDAQAQTSDQRAEPQPPPPVVAAADEQMSEEEAGALKDDAGKRAVRLLREADPQQRQRGAEILARLAAIEHVRLVHGYRLQERDERVRLALDWALYRLGRPEALFGVVNALNTKHREQAIEYLARLDEPSTLVALLRSPKREVKIGVLEALGRNGNEQAAHAIEPLVASKDIEIAAAAQLALTRIELRRNNKSAAPDAYARPRQVTQPPKAQGQN